MALPKASDTQLFEYCEVIMPDGRVLSAYRAVPPPEPDWWPHADCIAALISDDV